MNELLIFLIAAAAGVCLAVFYFGGLFLTTRRISRSKGSTLWLMVSFFGRLGVCVLGFYLVLNFTRLGGLIASVAGFVVTKFILVRTLGKKEGAG